MAHAVQPSEAWNVVYERLECDRSWGDRLKRGV